jgi:hypothetical protein
VSTTVIVPDRGAASLGGSGRAAYGTSRYGGRPRNRAIGIDRQAAGAHAAVQIHDPQAADAALLEQARRRRAPATENAGAARRFAERAAVDAALPSVAVLERRHAELAKAQARDEEARKARLQRVQTARQSAATATRRPVAGQRTP